MPGCLLFWSAGSLQIPLRHAFCHSGVACRIFQSANWPKATTESRPYRFMRGEKIFETVPEWTIRVAPLKEPLVIPHDNEEVLDSSKMSGSALSWQPNYPSLATAYSFHFMPVSLFWVKGQDQHKWRLCHYLT